MKRFLILLRKSSTALYNTTPAKFYKVKVLHARKPKCEESITDSTYLAAQLRNVKSHK